MDVDQAIAIGILLLIILSAVGIAFALLRLAKGTAASIAAEAREPASLKTAPASPLAYDPGSPALRSQIAFLRPTSEALAFAWGSSPTRQDQPSGVE